MKPKAKMPMEPMKSMPKPGTREYRDMQRMDFDKKMDAQKKRK